MHCGTIDLVIIWLFVCSFSGNVYLWHALSFYCRKVKNYLTSKDHLEGIYDACSVINACVSVGGLCSSTFWKLPFHWMSVSIWNYYIIYRILPLVQILHQPVSLLRIYQPILCCVYCIAEPTSFSNCLLENKIYI